MYRNCLRLRDYGERCTKISNKHLFVLAVKRAAILSEVEKVGGF